MKFILNKILLTASVLSFGSSSVFALDRLPKEALSQLQADAKSSPLLTQFSGMYSIYHDQVIGTIVKKGGLGLEKQLPAGITEEELYKILFLVRLHADQQKSTNDFFEGLSSWSQLPQKVKDAVVLGFKETYTDTPKEKEKLKGMLSQLDSHIYAGAQDFSAFPKSYTEQMKNVRSSASDAEYKTYLSSLRAILASTVHVMEFFEKHAQSS